MQKEDDKGCLDIDSIAKHLARRLAYVSSSSAHLLRKRLFSSIAGEHGCLIKRLEAYCEVKVGVPASEMSCVTTSLTNSLVTRTSRHLASKENGGKDDGAFIFITVKDRNS